MTVTHAEQPAFIVLEDGYALAGRPYGAQGSTIGEAVFVTAMTGYQETLTDPSYHRQIVIQTAPHIGNTGINHDDNESSHMWVAGYVLRDPSRIRSNWRSSHTLDQELAEQNIIGIAEVDTRALTRHLRDKGVMRAGIFSGDIARKPIHELTEQVRKAPSMAGAELASEVSRLNVETYPATGQKKFSIAAVDCGVKANSLALLQASGAEVHVVPADTSYATIESLGVDGVFFSNGPGDPATAVEHVEVIRELLRQRIPVFGICFGNQLLGRALGFDTYKLPFGHRGVNQPVMDVETGRVEITAHNHGFAVDVPLHQVVHAPYSEDFGRVKVSHIGLNDQVVEGLQCLDIPAFSVQFHPEAAAGPHDSEHLFARFLSMIEQHS